MRDEKRGRKLDQKKVSHVIKLLYDTDMTLGEIGKATGLSTSTITQINREMQIRIYRGSRTKWDLRNWKK